MDPFVCDYCCVELSSIANMEAHLAGKRHQRQKAILEHRKEESRRSIFVTNLPFSNNIEQLLLDYFKKFGSVKNVISDTKKGFFAIVEFININSANKALRAVHWLQGRKLSVKEKRVKYPQPRTRADCKQTEESDERMNEHLIEKIRCYKSIEKQMIILQTELCLSVRSLNIRQDIRNVLHSVLIHYFPNSELYLFGSSANGFGFEGCDVDLHLKLPISWFEMEDDKLIENPPGINDVEAGNVKTELLSNSAKLKLMKKIIQKYVHNAKRVFYIPSHRCPLLRFNYEYSEGELICDLSVGKGISVRNTNLLWLYRQLDSRVLLLIATLRWWAKCQKLINSDCKLTSYAFIFMVIFFLQTLDPPLVPKVEELKQMAEMKCVIDNWDCSFCEDFSKIPKSTNKQSVEGLLKDFFHFYANFDYTTNVISPRFGHVICQSVFSSDPFYKEFKIGPVCIQDPFILNRNISGNFSVKYLPELIAKFAHCAKFLSEVNQHTKDGDYGIAALMKEIVVESEGDGPVSFTITFNVGMFKSMDDTSFIANLSEQEMMTIWFKKVCLLVKDVLERALCCECEIIVDRCSDNKPQLTRKRSLSFGCDNEQQQKHFMRDVALQDREVSNFPSVSSTCNLSVVDSSEQGVVPCIRIGDMGNAVSTKDSKINYPTKANTECTADEEMPNSDDSEICSRVVSSLQKSELPKTNEVSDNEKLLHMHCKVSDDIWHQRKKESKKHKSEKCNILDIEHEISQIIIKRYGNNKYLLFDCILQKQQTGGIMGVKVEMKSNGKNSFQKIKQFIMPFVSKLVHKCIATLSH